jgi:hypothetical protein
VDEMAIESGFAITKKESYVIKLLHESVDGTENIHEEIERKKKRIPNHEDAELLGDPGGDADMRIYVWECMYSRVHHANGMEQAEISRTV